VGLFIKSYRFHDEFVLIWTPEGGGFQCTYDC